MDLFIESIREADCLMCVCVYVQSGNGEAGAPCLSFNQTYLAHIKQYFYMNQVPLTLKISQNGRHKRTHKTLYHS